MPDRDIGLTDDIVGPGMFLGGGPGGEPQEIERKLTIHLPTFPGGTRETTVLTIHMTGKGPNAQTEVTVDGNPGDTEEYHAIISLIKQVI